MSIKESGINENDRRLGYGIQELAEMIGCSPGHIRNLIDRKELPSVKLGRRRIVPADNARALLAPDNDAGAAEAA